MDNHSWKEISIKEKMQIINGTVLVSAAIILYFLAFAITLEIGYNVIAAGTTLLATGLAFFGITSYIKNQLFEMKTEVELKMKQLEELEKRHLDET